MQGVIQRVADGEARAVLSALRSNVRWAAQTKEAVCTAQATKRTFSYARTCVLARAFPFLHIWC